MKSHLPYIFALVAFVATGADALAGDWQDEGFDSLPAQLKATMPDQHNPDTRAALRCSVCHWCVVELHSAVNRLNQTARKRAETSKKTVLPRPTQDEIDDVFDDYCTPLLPEYGLHVDEAAQLIKPKYTRLANKVQGDWIARIFENECSAFVTQFSTNDKARKWRALTALWGSDNSIEEPKFLKLCPACDSAAGKAGYPSRNEAAMWMNEMVRMKEDWDL